MPKPAGKRGAIWQATRGDSRATKRAVWSWSRRSAAIRARLGRRGRFPGATQHDLNLWARISLHGRARRGTQDDLRRCGWIVVVPAAGAAAIGGAVDAADERRTTSPTG